MTIEHDKEELKKIFGTPAAGRRAVHNWKQKWSETRKQFRIDSMTEVIRWANENNIDQLYYKVSYNTTGAEYYKTVAFYSEEDELLFTLHR